MAVKTFLFRLQRLQTANTAESSNRNVDNFHRRQVTSRIANSGDTQQIYTTANTFDHLKSLLYCENRNDDGEEEGKPCLCHRCGMVGLLIESQKRPIMVDYGGSDVRTSGSHHQKRKDGYSKTESVNRNSSSVSFGLVDRVDRLELRVAQQEQRGVSKEYFRRVITRLFDQLRPRMLSRPPTRNSSTQDRRTYEPVPHHYMNRDEMEYMRSKYRLYSHQPQVYHQSAIPRSIISLQKAANSSKVKGESKVKNFGVSEDRDVLLFWGNEPIKHGFDLKSKISRLVEEKFVKLFKGRSDKNPSLTNDLFATKDQGVLTLGEPCTNVQKKVTRDKRSKIVLKQKPHLNMVCLEPLEVGVDTVRPQVKQHSRASMIPRYKFPLNSYCNYTCKTCSSLFDRTKSPNEDREECCKGEKVHVAYLNPAVVCWANESDPSNDEHVIKTGRLKVLQDFDNESWEEERSRPNTVQAYK